jgi:C_GCAxxG_C_C family probable redox protein
MIQNSKQVFLEFLAKVFCPLLIEAHFVVGQLLCVWFTTKRNFKGQSSKFSFLLFCQSAKPFGYCVILLKASSAAVFPKSFYVELNSFLCTVEVGNVISENGVRELQEKAAKRFQAKPVNFPEGRPYNCCESVLLTLAEYLGVESEFVPKIATGIGAGFSLNGLTCGTISGAAMSIGLKHGRKNSEDNPQATWSRVDKFIEAFKDRWGAVTCRELTGLDVKTAEGLKEYFRSVHDFACTDRVKFAVKKAIELME